MSRFKIDIYDEVKANDITLYEEEGLSKETLSQLVWSHIDQFQGNVTGVVYDLKNKKRTVACYFPMDYLEPFRNRKPNRVSL